MTNKEATARQMERYRNDPEYRTRILDNKRKYRAKAEAKVKAMLLLKQPQHRFLNNIRTRLNERLEFIGASKFRGALSVVIGCSPTILRVRFEQMFRDGMNWGNYGSLWEIDHIKPISLAKTQESVFALNHYSNLQPLLKRENQAKADKLEVAGGG